MQHSVSYLEGSQLENGQFEQTKSGRLRTKEGASARQAASERALAVPSNCKLISASIVKNDDDTEADYSYTIRSLFSSLPDNVLVAERIVDESIEDGVKTTTYRATFVGSGASYAAERFKPEGEIIRQSKSASEDDNSVTITYTVKDSVDGTQRLRYHNAVAIDWALPAKTTFESDGQPPLIMDGARGVTTITEEGFSIWKGVVPPPHPPITSAGLVLTNKATKVEPESEEITGLPNTYSRTWSYTYWVSDEITEESLNVSTLLNPLEK